ncbi:hypothetical protein K461DRAFT_103907 [Myriangium duriaei CBS 260.36]|uniref:Uncharacterized protein n=1 Tax=Myriangium duriaei CBS 260.36 TaxID=1168546 RepID=A0A9P4J4F1_9PEZI|nr:hypothetical protein K461DRAFT_103907 [Myriangium duriaei CBS 260.36]
MPLKPESSLSDSISTLQISEPSTPPRRKGKPPAAEVADSWEDDLASDSEQDPSGTTSSSQSASGLLPTQSKDLPEVPPPTPAGGVARTPTTDWSRAESKFEAFSEQEGLSYGRSGNGRGAGDDKRPEKSTAVASRLIAAGLGVRAPRRTEEQREYDRAIRAQERKKKEKEAEEEKRRKEESERAKRAMWED